jgi:hypothetical protein
MTTAREMKSLGFVDSLIACLGNALHPSEGEAEPVALLWTDADSQWRGLMPSLRVALPELYTLGPYDPTTRTGPAIWLKCIVDRTIPEESPAPEKTPILYLPGVSWQVLRAAGDCPTALLPLIELQYRGEVWHQRNGRDWTVEAFLVSEDGLGLDVAQDAKTHEAMLRALPLLAEAPITTLRGARLEADDFDKLAVSDPIRDLLRWMNNPNLFQQTSDEGRWRAFCNICKSEFDLDPDEDGVAAAAAHLQTGTGRWDDVWDRFSEAPRLYPGVPSLLREPGSGQGQLALDVARSPLANEQGEANLRLDLKAISEIAHHDACNRLLTLEKQHGMRRTWVWTQLDESPLAVALEPLAKLASFAKSPLSGTDIEGIVGAYTSDGWRCDWAAIEALALPSGPGDSTLISRVVAALYQPWLDASARNFQALVALKDDFRELVTGVTAERETCVVFVDGLRFDIGGALKEKLEALGLSVQLGHRMSPLPTVTATAKPLASPAYAELEGTVGSDEFSPIITTTGQLANASRLRDRIAALGIEVLDPEEMRIPAGTPGGGWTETGRLDELGHKLGIGLAAQVNSDLERIVDRVSGLLGSGWRRIRIVTDHGWLLLPEGLPKVDLAAYLVATKWARCATVKGEATPAIPIYPWYWNPHVRIASPHGIACFNVGNEYAHGGVSLQECIVPELVIERGVQVAAAKIVDVSWRRMRCRVRVETNASGLKVDLREKWKQAETTIATSMKEVDADGEASLVVEDESREGAAVTLVIVDAAGTVLDRKGTTVGEE